MSAGPTGGTDGPDPTEAGLWRVLERVDGVLGELVLRERETPDGLLTDLVCNGVQVMDDAGADSEVALAEAALDALAWPGVAARPEPGDGPAGRGLGAALALHVVVGGLGMAFTVAALLADARLGPRGRVTVVEVEPAVVRWNREGRFTATSGTLQDPRVAVVVGDVADALGSMTGGDLDAVLLDVDNGPGFLVAPSNAGLYESSGLAVAGGALRRGGVLAVWSAQAAPELGVAMGRAVGPAGVHAVEVVREGRTLRYWVHVATRR